MTNRASFLQDALAERGWFDLPAYSGSHLTGTSLF